MNSAPVWNADLGDGTYRNPILYADYSDPDAIRVGDDFFMVASSFSNAPGLPLLHSKDLVNWKVVNYILPRLPFPDYDVPAHGRGVWAPSIRYHAGLFWVCFPMPDEGIFFSTASDPFGTWSEPFPVWQGKGWIDPCPFWDDDGRAYLVTAYAKSRCGINSILRLSEMKPDGTGLIGKGRDIYDGHATQPTIEGPKFYKRDGWYYILAPAGSVKHGWQTALRARNIWGPYEERIVMLQGGTPTNGPHQGALLDTQGGESWFLHFQDVGTCGRIVHLQPAEWIDGWPVIGRHGDGETCGRPVSVQRKPAVGGEYPPTQPADSDDFTGAALGLQWQWNANPQPAWYSLGPGGLTLSAMPDVQNLCDLPNLLLQKFPGPSFTATLLLKTAALAENSEAGLVVLGGRYGTLSLRRENGFLLLRQRSGEIRGGEETRIIHGRMRLDGDVYLRLEVKNGEDCTLSYGLDGERFWPIYSFTTSAGVWVGAKAGIYCAGPSGSITARQIQFCNPNHEL